MAEPDFYLASSEGYDFEDARRCWRIKRFSSPDRDDLLLIRIDPAVAGQRYGLGARNIDRVLVATRHVGASLFPITEWPVFVHVARLLVENVEGRDRLQSGEFESIAWAELYRTEEDARKKQESWRLR